MLNCQLHDQFFKNLYLYLQDGMAKVTGTKLELIDIDPLPQPERHVLGAFRVPSGPLAGWELE
jgi:hypothetical protein